MAFVIAGRPLTRTPGVKKELFRKKWVSIHINMLVYHCGLFLEPKKGWVKLGVRPLYEPLNESNSFRGKVCRRQSPIRCLHGLRYSNIVVRANEQNIVPAQVK